MTPASVDGGPDEGPVLKEVRKRIERVREPVAACQRQSDVGLLEHWLGYQKALVEMALWLEIHEPRPSTTRDAALREEMAALKLENARLQRVMAKREGEHDATIEAVANRLEEQLAALREEGRVQGEREGLERAAEIAADVVEQFRGSTAEWTAARVRDAIRTLLATKPATVTPRGCAVCGKPATCIGAYDNAKTETPACDACCAHGNEDGHCRPIATPDASQGSAPGPCCEGARRCELVPGDATTLRGWTCHDHGWTDHPPAAPQGSPLPGGAVPRGHCNRCERCGWKFGQPGSADCWPSNCSMRPMPPPRTHCAGCGAIFDDVVTPGNPPEGGALPVVAWSTSAVEAVARAIFAADALHSEGGDVAWDGITAEYQEDMRAVALAALAAAATPEGGALEGELAERLRGRVKGCTCKYDSDDGVCPRCRVDAALIARYDAAKAIPQSGTVKEGTDGK